MLSSLDDVALASIEQRWLYREIERALRSAEECGLTDVEVTARRRQRDHDVERASRSLGG